MANKRITWNENERTLVYDEMVKIYTEGRITVLENVIRKAQLVLPVERRRKIYNSMLYNLKDWALKARLEANTIVRDRKLTEVALASVPASAFQPEPKKTEDLESGLSELIDKVVEQLAKRVAKQALKQLSEYLSSGDGEGEGESPCAVSAVAPQTVVAPKVRRKSVTIIGLKGQQITSVMNKYNDLDITCLTSDEAQSRAVVNSDHTILMTKFIKHATYSKYRQTPNLQYCNGGVSDLFTIMHVIRNS